MADFVKLKLDHLESQAGKLHAIIDDYFKQITIVGKTWLENIDGSDISIEEMNELLENTALFVSYKCSELEVDPEVIQGILARIGTSDPEALSTQTEKTENISWQNQGARDVGNCPQGNTCGTKNETSEVLAALSVFSKEQTGRIKELGNQFTHLCERSDQLERHIRNMVMGTHVTAEHLKPILNRQLTIECQVKDILGKFAQHTARLNFQEAQLVKFAQQEKRMDMFSAFKDQQCKKITENDTYMQKITAKLEAFEKQVGDISVKQLALAEEQKKRLQDFEQHLKELLEKQTDFSKKLNNESAVTGKDSEMEKLLKNQVKKQSQFQGQLEDVLSKHCGQEKKWEYLETCQIDLGTQIKRLSSRQYELEKEVEQIQVKQSGFDKRFDDSSRCMSTKLQDLEKAVDEVGGKQLSMFEQHGKRLNELEKQAKRLKSEVGKNHDKKYMDLERHMKTNETKISKSDGMVVSLMEEVGNQMASLRDMKKVFEVGMSSLSKKVEILEDSFGQIASKANVPVSSLNSVLTKLMSFEKSMHKTTGRLDDLQMLHQELSSSVAIMCPVSNSIERKVDCLDDLLHHVSSAIDNLHTRVRELELMIGSSNKMEIYDLVSEVTSQTENPLVDSTKSSEWCERGENAADVKSKESEMHTLEPSKQVSSNKQGQQDK